MLKFTARRDYRLVAPAVGAWLAAIWAIGAELAHMRLVALVIAAVALTTFAAWWAARHWFALSAQALARPVLLGALTCAVVATVLGVIAVHESRWQQALLAQAVKAEGRVQVVGEVTSDVEALPQSSAASWHGQRWRLTMRVVQTKYRGISAGQSARITVIGGSELTEVRAGELIEISARAKPTPAGDEARALLFVNEGVSTIETARGPHGLGGQIRARLRQAVEPLPPAARSLIPAMVVGDRSQIETNVAQAMKDVSLTHLTAVSGAHCTLIIGAALAVIRVPRAWPRRWARVLRGGGAVTVLCAFVIATGPQPSVLRAAVMGAVGLLGLLRGRRSQALAALAIAVIALLLVDPWLARNIGFCLSVSSTSAIILAAGPLATRLRERRIPGPVALGLAVSIVAQIACLPLLLVIDPRLPIYAVPANVLAGPVFPLVSLPGALGLVIALVLPPLAQAVLWIAAGPAQAISWIARGLAALPGATVDWPPPPGFWWLITALAICGAGVWRFRDGFIKHRRRATGLVLCAAFIIWAATHTEVGSSVRQRIGLREPGTDWVAIQCDVGQGDALLLRSRFDAVVMIDVGPPGPGAKNCLADAQVAAVDLLVLTHWHLDHVGGLEPVLESVPVEAALLPAWNEPAATATQADALITEYGINRAVAVASPGQAGWDFYLEGLSGEIIWPTNRAVELMPPGAADGTSVNDLSTVLLFSVETSGGPVGVLALGDIEDAGQRGVLRQLQERDFVGPVDLVKMAHHGSARQSAQLAQLIRPRAAFIGVGADNDYGHPAPAAIQMYTETGASIGATDRNGQITMITEPDSGLHLLVESVP